MNEQQIRGWIRNILNEQRQNEARKILVEYGTEYALVNQPGLFRKAFIEPFTDVLKIAGVGIKDLLTDVVFQVRMLFTINAKKAEEISARYDDRKKKIAVEMDKAFESTKGYLPDVYTDHYMPIAPAAAMARLAFEGGTTGWASLKKLAKDIGVDENTIPDESKYEELQRTRDERPAVEKAIGELEQLFLNPVAIAAWAFLGPNGKKEETPAATDESRRQVQPVLVEGEDAPPKKSPKDAEAEMQQMINQFLENPKVEAYFSNVAEATLKAKNEQIDELTAEVQAQLQMIESVVSAKSYEEFITSLQTIETTGISIDAAPLAQLKQQVQDGVNKILNNPDARAGIEQELRQRAGIAEGTAEAPPTASELPAISEEELIDVARTAVFMQAKQQLQDELYEGTNELKDHVIEIIMNDVPPADVAKELKKTPAGLQYFELIEDSVRAIEAL
jgi:phosphoribosylformylglycinamidine (FGAM) synthase PurS component